MGIKRIVFIEICIGVMLFVIGFILWFWSKQLLWILIFPPPVGKFLIESLSPILWCLGVFLIIDGVRRNIKV